MNTQTPSDSEPITPEHIAETIRIRERLKKGEKLEIEAGFFADGIDIYDRVEWRDFSNGPFLRLCNPRKLQPTYIPYSFEDDLLGIKVKSNDNSMKCMIVKQNVLGINWNHASYTYQELFSNFTHLDGTPCGKLQS